MKRLPSIASCLTTPLAPLAALLIAALLLAAATPAQDRYRPRPLPAGKDSYTRPDFNRDAAAAWKQVLLAYCEATGALQGQWKEDIEQIVDVYAKVCGHIPLSNDVYYRAYELAERMERKECKLPLALLVVADSYTWQGKPEKANDAFEALQQVARDQAPVFRMLHAKARFRWLTRRGQPQAAARATADSVDAIIELSAIAKPPKNFERFLLFKMLTAANDDVGARHAPWIDRLEKRVGKDHFAVLVLRARLHNQLAWNARGTGVAASVSEKDFGTFGHHMEKSAEYAAAAAKRFPQHPEGACAMMSAIGPAGGGLRELRRWFDLAVAAQFDWDDAYRTYMHYLQPRWGGSQRALLKIGEECIDSGRFDTGVPTHYRLAIYYIALDSRYPLKIWARRSVQEQLDKLDAGMIEAASTRRGQWQADTNRMMTLALGDKLDEAVKLYEKWQKEVDPAQLQVYQLDEDWVHKTMRPLLSDYQPASIESRDLFAGYETAKGFAGARPLKSFRDAPVRAQSDAQWRDWISTSFVAAYREHGKRDDKWNADVEKLLSSFGKIVNGDITEADTQLVIKLFDAECDDPLFEYVGARTLARLDLDMRLGLMMDLLPRLEKRYSSTFAWWGYHHCRELLVQYGDSVRSGAMRAEHVSHVVRATADDLCSGRGRRNYVRALWGEADFVQPGTQLLEEEAVAQLKKLDDADPWLSHFIQGHHHAHRARFPKGTMIQRIEDLKKAAHHMTEAWRIAPELPEAATVMITVAMLDAEVAGATPREWFDRAIKAQFDYPPAYNALLTALQPRNGGSLQAMYRFGVECLESGRFDTGTPLYLAFALQRIQAELEQPREAWAANGVREHLDAMFDGYLQTKPAAAALAFYRAGRCMTAWAAGDYETARERWLEAGKKLDPSWLPIIGSNEMDLVESDLRYLDRKANGK